MSIFHPLVVVGHGRETLRQVSETFNILTFFSKIVTIVAHECTPHPPHHPLKIQSLTGLAI